MLFVICRRAVGMSEGCLKCLCTSELFQGGRLAVLILNNAIDSNIMRKVCGAAQYIACADGGANRLYDEMEGLVIPNAVIGDLDSLRPDVEFFLCEKGTKIVKIVDQDRHDLDKSLDYLHTNCAKICEEFTSKSGEQMAGRFSVIILGALGGRFDQDMANLNAIHKWTSSFASLALVAKENIVFLLDEGSHQIRPDKDLEGPTCGLIPLGSPAKIVTTTGLKWNLEKQELKFGGLISTSNQFDDAAVVTVETSHPLLWTTAFRSERLRDTQKQSTE